MKVFLFCLLFSLSAVADLNQTFKEERQRPDKAVWFSLKENLSGFHVVFVEHKDWMFRYLLRSFKDNIATLKEDLDYQQVTVVNTGFFDSYETNAASLSVQLERAYADGGKKPLVVIGAPQSSVDVLYTVLKMPKFLTDGTVAKLVLVQSAFGSPVVDAILQSNDASLKGFVTSYFGGKFKKFLTAPTRALFSDALAKLDGRQRGLLNGRLYWVRSATSYLRLTPYLRVPYLLMRLRGFTDAITFTDEQKIDGIGRDLGVVAADHWDLFASLPASNSLPNFRKAFTRALLREIF